MIYRKDELSSTHPAALRGGQGTVDLLHLLSPADVEEKLGLFALVTLQPGCSIGEHPHVTDGEAYVVVEGEASFTEDGTEALLRPGDVAYTAHGSTHSIANHGDTPLRFLALIIK